MRKPQQSSQYSIQLVSIIQTSDMVSSSTRLEGKRTSEDTLPDVDPAFTCTLQTFALHLVCVCHANEESLLAKKITDMT
jgi:hypothetical protein